MRKLLLCLGLSAGLLLATGCPSDAGSSAPPKPLSPAGVAKLVAADKADGKEDKVVVKCPACMLKMDGHEKHARTLEGYTVYSCHSACADALMADPEALLARLP